MLTFAGVDRKKKMKFLRFLFLISVNDATDLVHPDLIKFQPVHKKRGGDW